MLELIVAVSCALVISAGCSLFEAVLYSVPLRHIESLAAAGRSSGRTFKRLRGDIEKPIAAILSLNTIANTAGAAFAGSAASAVFGHEKLGLFSALFTLAILIFSEIVPKTAGVVYARPLAPLVAHPMQALVWGMRPVVWLTSLVTRLIARKQKGDVVTAEELRLMARLSQRSGGIKPYQEQAIDRILSLSHRKVRDVMTPRTVIFSLSEHLSLGQASLVPGTWEHSRVPVYDEDKEDLVGLVMTKELFRSLAEGKHAARLSELMRPVHYVMEAAALSQVLLEFLERREHLFVVLDEYGGIVGVISLEDILEEILGREIVDESDKVADKRELARQRRKELVEGTSEQGSP